MCGSAGPPVQRTSIFLGLLAGIILSPRLSHAQYSANFQTNIISGVTSNWTGDYLIGSNTVSQAQTNSWIGPSDGKWEKVQNWDDGLPSITQSAVIIRNANSQIVTIDRHNAH